MQLGTVGRRPILRRLRPLLRFNIVALLLQSHFPLAISPEYLSQVLLLRDADTFGFFHSLSGVSNSFRLFKSPIKPTFAQMPSCVNGAPQHNYLSSNSNLLQNGHARNGDHVCQDGQLRSPDIQFLHIPISSLENITLGPSPAIGILNPELRGDHWCPHFPSYTRPAHLTDPISGQRSRDPD
jgi:hypothetical protein